MQTNQTQTQQISGVINSCVIKRQGETNGRVWTIHEVDINGQKFSTFDGMFQNMIGMQGTWNYTTRETQGQNGRIYYNKTLVPAEIKKIEQPTRLTGSPTPIGLDKEKTSKNIARMNALTNSVKYFEGKPASEIEIMNLAETFFKWIMDENYIKGMTNTPTSESDEPEVAVEDSLDLPF